MQIRLHDQQRERSFLSVAMNQGLSVITGGPGTGKTTIVQCLLLVLKCVEKDGFWRLQQVEQQRDFQERQVLKHKQFIDFCLLMDTQKKIFTQPGSPNGRTWNIN